MPEMIQQLQRTLGLEIDLAKLMDVYNEGSVVSLPESHEPFEAEAKQYADALSTEEALAHLEAEGLAPATARQLLAYAMKHPEAEAIAFGSQITVANHGFVFLLRKGQEQRELAIEPDRRGEGQEKWPPGTVFLAVPKGVA